METDPLNWTEAKAIVIYSMTFPVFVFCIEGDERKIKNKMKSIKCIASAQCDNWMPKQFTNFSFFCFNLLKQLEHARYFIIILYFIHFLIWY